MSNQQADLKHEVDTLAAQNQELQARLKEAEETLRAITAGEVDALVTYSENGERIYTLEGADYTYRIMVESINEGAASITPDGVILYCNQRLADMLGLPLEKVLGSSFNSYITSSERSAFESQVTNGTDNSYRGEFNLVTRSEGTLPVLISASNTEVQGHCSYCLVVTDLTQEKQARARERELQIRLTEQREEERVRIAHNLHDGPIQDLIGLSFNLEDILSTGRGAGLEADLKDIRENVHQLISQLRNVCNELRPPSILQFGLHKAFQAHRDDFNHKFSDVQLTFESMPDTQRISKDISAVLYRIYQECVNNIVRHANATAVNVRLFLEENFVLLEVQDNGQGFEITDDWVELARQGHLGLVGMRERAEAVGGKLHVHSTPGKGTTIQVEVPYTRPAR